MGLVVVFHREREREKERDPASKLAEHFALSKKTVDADGAHIKFVTNFEPGMVDYEAGSSRVQPDFDHNHSANKAYGTAALSVPVTVNV